jgi:predicted  nucleic acid-binding Zn-ribbon protein
MSEFPFQKFIKLVEFDQGIRLLDQQKSTVQAEIADHESHLKKLSDELDVAKRHQDAMQREVTRYEQEMADLVAKQREKEQLLDRTTNARESRSVYQEIETVKVKQFQLEEQVLSAWNKLENSQREYQQLKQKIDEKITAEQSALDQAQQKLQTLISTIEQDLKKSTEMQEGIPVEWLEKYEIMRRTVSNPVVPVKNNSCSACFYPIIAQDLARLRHHALLQCKDCYRFLYMEPL